MEESERSRLRNLQREQERERRRIRDRQRRESMSHEQRERHLARRRRNYQLRRQRAANVTIDSLSDQRMLIDSDDKMTGDERQISSFDPQLIAHYNGVDCIEFDEGMDKLEGFDALAQGRLRLNHVKKLARSLHQRAGELIVSNRCQILTESIQLRDALIDCRPLKELRFIHVKRLARKLYSPVKENTVQVCIIEKEDIAESVQPSNDKGEDEQCRSDE